jgi:hypothetical protein
MLWLAPIATLALIAATFALYRLGTRHPGLLGLWCDAGCVLTGAASFVGVTVSLSLITT